MPFLRLFLLIFCLAPLFAQKTVVFWEDGFPTVESAPVSRATLEQVLHPHFLDAAALSAPGALSDAELLVLPYGSAFPLNAWPAIKAYSAAGGNILVMGGRPFAVPVRRAAGGLITGEAVPTWSRYFGIGHTYEAPQKDFVRIVREFDFDFLPELQIQARRVFVNTAERGGSYRAMAFFQNGAGRSIAAPVTRMDFPDRGARCVFLSFEPEPGYWSTAAGEGLLRAAANHTKQGSAQLWVEAQNASVHDGEAPQVVVHLSRVRRPLNGSVRLELKHDSRVVTTKEVLADGDAIQESVTFPTSLEPGLYTVRAAYTSADAVEEVYHTGFWVRDERILRSGALLQTAGDYFQAGGKPMLLFGTNYFSTDIQNTGFFVGGNLAGNAWRWEQDFAEMQRHNVNFVRTGIWHNHTWYLDRVTGAAEERLLRAIEAFVLSAGRHGIQVHFTFFGMDPQTIHRRGQSSLTTHPGTNPYTDPVAVAAEKRYLLSIARRFKDVPYVSWDLINEPSFSNPQHIFRGNYPNADPTEYAAWNRWLEKRYRNPETLASAWGVTVEELGAFGRIPLPEVTDLAPARYGNDKLVRALDYNLFAQDMFNAWAREMVAAIQGIGSRQLVTVGQDEGGVSNRLLNQFYGDSGVNFTVNHSWWRDDALLFDSVAAKRPDMPNLIGETGVQPVWRMDGSWRYDEPGALALYERKMALGFAAANSGSLHWDWARGDTFGIMRRDGSFKEWADVQARMGQFAREASPFAMGARKPEVAIVLPQSLQLSVLNNMALDAQQKAIRAMFHQARTLAYAVGEYQIGLLGDPKLIVVPSPWAFRQEAWEAILAKVRGGATLLLTGRFDLDEHFRSTPRASGLPFGSETAALTTRENVVKWPGGEALFRFPGDGTTYLERAVLPNGATFAEAAVGKGRVLYYALPLELSASEDALGKVYRYAVERAAVRPIYTTGVIDPGILIAPTQLEKATLYVLTSESSTAQHATFRDAASGKQIDVMLEPGRAALLVVTKAGEIVARYDSRPAS